MTEDLFVKKRTLSALIIPVCVTAFILLLYGIGLFNRIDGQIYDLTFRIRGKRSADNRIVIVSVDRESKKRLGNLIKNRTTMAKAVTNLSEKGAEVIGLDYIYPPESASKEENQIFADALCNSVNVVLGTWISQGEWRNCAEVLRDSCIFEGMLNVKEDEDNVIRKAEFIEAHRYNSAGEKEVVFFFPLAVAIVYEIFQERTSIENVNPDENGFVVVTRKSKSGEMLTPLKVDTRGFWYNFAGERKSFTWIPFWKIYENNFTANEVKGKIILIGETELTSGDVYATPFSVYRPPSPGSYPVLCHLPGVEIHASGIQTILECSDIKHVGKFFLLLLTAIIGLLYGAFLICFHRGGFLAPSIAAIALMTLSVLISLLLFSYGNTYFSAVPLLTVLCADFVSGMTYKWLAARKRIKQVVDMFGKYVSPNIVRRIISGEIKITLRGHEKEITTLFADLRSFTSISEKLGAEKTGILLNAYFSRMIKVVFERDGTLDKLIGDCIMVFFNDPDEQEDCAIRAADTALAIINELEDFKKSNITGVENLMVGIGINSGNATVGNLGAPQFVDYTAIGDTVNLASRLESLTKEYAVPIIVSESTFELIKSVYKCRELDIVQVKGKSNATKIYELIEKEGELSVQQKTLIKLFNESLLVYRNRNFAEALELFKNILTLYPDDYPAQMYIKRCKNFIETPPRDDWKAIFVLTNK
ncbi:MAG: adenylate/guanylate cyclase domain-containing protein [Planctomycetota bacterium]